MKRDTTSRGDLTEMEVAMGLLRAGRKVLKPFSTGLRYDLVIDNEDGSFTRVQCKTGILKGGCIQFRLYSVSGHRTRGISYQGQVDAFGVHCPQNGGTYLVPISALARCEKAATLRLHPAKNGQTQGVRYARDYAVSRDGAEPRLPLELI